MNTAEPEFSKITQVNVPQDEDCAGREPEYQADAILCEWARVATFYLPRKQVSQMLESRAAAVRDGVL